MKIHHFVVGMALSFVIVGANRSEVSGAIVTLQSPTATFSQSSFGDFSVANTIANPTTSSWAIFNAGVTSAQTAVWETQSDVGFLGGTDFTFTIAHTDTTVGIDSQPDIGRFRLSYTTDSRSDFADGLINGGDVTATWTVFDTTSFVSTGGGTATELGDLSLLIAGGANSSSTYTIGASTLATGITGIRLEALEHASLSTNGPGRHANGNFHISLFTVDATASAVPEPSSALFVTGILLVGTLIRTRRYEKTRMPAAVVGV